MNTITKTKATNANQPKTNYIQKGSKTLFSTHQLVMTALFAALICVSAYISIALPNGSHLSLLNAAIMIIILIFPPLQSFCTILIWFLLGAVGVPVFAGGYSGFGYLFSYLGGYSFAFLLIGIVIPILAGKKYNRIRFTILAILSAVIIDVVGSLWWMAFGKLNILDAFAAGFIPFIFLDLIKAIVVAQIVPQLRMVTLDFDSTQH